MQVDDVLAELKQIGALGVPARPAPKPTRVSVVDLEEASPEAELIDQRGEQMVILLSEAGDRIDEAIEGLRGLRGTIEAMRRVWATEPLGAEIFVPTGAEGGATGSSEAPMPVAFAADAADESQQATLEAIRQRIRREVRGEDLSEEDRMKAFLDDDGAVPLVGSRRAIPNDDETTTVGTLGSIRPNLPEE